MAHVQTGEHRIRRVAVNIRYRLGRWQYNRARDRFASELRMSIRVLYRGYYMSLVDQAWIVWRETPRCLYVRVVSIWTDYRAARSSMFLAANTAVRQMVK